MRVLLLGGTGFIGARLSRRLRALGHEVVTSSRSSSADIPFDAHDLTSVREYLRRQRFDAIVNLAGAGLAAATVDPVTLVAVNASFPGAVLATLLEQRQPPAFLHAASSTERTLDTEPDESEYSRTKHQGALALRELAVEAATPVTLLRIHNTYGPEQPTTRFVAHTFARLAAANEVVLNYPGRIRDFVFVDDVVDSFTTALQLARPGLHEEDIGTGVGTTLLDVAQRIAVLLGQPRDLVRGVEPPPHDPHPVAVASRPAGSLGTCVTSLDEGLSRMAGGR